MTIRRGRVRLIALSLVICTPLFGMPGIATATVHHQTSDRDGGGSTWIPEEAPVPSNAYVNNGPDLLSVACPITNQCFGVGDYYSASGGEGIPEGVIDTLSGMGSSFIEAPLPTPGTRGALLSISCVTTTSCVAVGSYSSNGSDVDGLIDTLANGAWTATEAPMPSGGGIQLTQVACPVAGTCVAIGEYSSSGVDFPGQGLIETLSSGTWSDAIAPLPSNASEGQSNQILRDLSCLSAASCVAVGDYPDTQGNTQGLIETLAQGMWTPVEATLPPGGSVVNQDASLNGLSCPEVGSCVAAGYYGTGSNPLGLIETLSGGTWTRAEAPLPASATGAQITAVECPTTGSCVAVGLRQPSNLGFAETLHRGIWTAEDVPIPSNAERGGPGPGLSLPACPTKRLCVSVGTYTAKHNLTLGLIEKFSGRRWTVIEAPLPSNSAENSALNAVACPVARHCVAVGGYTDKTKTSEGLIESQ